MAEKGWIAGATKNKGSLHRALGVDPNKKIPAAKMREAARSRNPRIQKMATLAHTLAGLRK